MIGKEVIRTPSNATGNAVCRTANGTGGAEKNDRK
jgi:hypothetical protein